MELWVIYFEVYDQLLTFSQSYLERLRSDLNGAVRIVRINYLVEFRIFLDVQGRFLVRFDVASALRQHLFKVAAEPAVKALKRFG